MNTSLLQSTNALQNAISDSANASNIANLQSTNAIQTQLADCCCQNRQGQAQIQYDMATNPYANYGFGCYCGSTNNGCC